MILRLVLRGRDVADRRTAVACRPGDPRQSRECHRAGPDDHDQLVELISPGEGACAAAPLNEKSNCDRTVIRGFQNPQQYGGLPRYTERYFQPANSLNACALASLRVAHQHRPQLVVFKAVQNHLSNPV